jgi:hypothetical protein
MLLSGHWNAGQNLNMLKNAVFWDVRPCENGILQSHRHENLKSYTEQRLFENLSQFKYLGMTVTNKICFGEKLRGE